MKRLIALIAVAAFLFPVCIMAGNMNTPGTATKKTVLRNHRGTSNRPNAPSRYSVECIYGDGFIEFIFPENISFLSVTLNNGTEEFSETMSIDNPVVYLPTMEGEYNIECTDDFGRVYYGTITW